MELRFVISDVTKHMIYLLLFYFIHNLYNRIEPLLGAVSLKDLL